MAKIFLESRLFSLIVAAVSRLEKYLPLILAIIIPFITVFNVTAFLEKVDIKQQLLTYFQTAFTILVLWYSNRWLIKLSVNKKSKLIFLLGGNLVVVLALSFLGSMNTPEKIDSLVNFWSILIRLSMVVIIFNVVFRVFESQKEQSRLQVQNLALQSENLKFQVETLKQQINPHFLFNSLNTLLDLIEDDPEEAAVFTRKFSNLYRVVLQSVAHDFIPLRDELRFLNDYWGLLQTRFRNAIALKVKIEEEKYELQIPPLSLQFLVENAVKHNEASSRDPLTLTIKEENNRLIISNRINPKKYPVQSEKVGLKNLEKRFNLLFQPIEFGKDGEEFVVKLPLKS